MLLARISADLRCGPITALRRDSVLRVAPRPSRHSEARARGWEDAPAKRTRLRPRAVREWRVGRPRNRGDAARGVVPSRGRCAVGARVSSRWWRWCPCRVRRRSRRGPHLGRRAASPRALPCARSFPRVEPRPLRARRPAAFPDRRPKGARPKHRSRRDGKPRPPCSAEGEPGASIATAETAPAPDAVETIVPAETNASATATAAAAAAASKPASKLPAGDDGPSARETATVAAFALLLAGAVASAGGPQGAADEITRAGRLLVENHIPGVGGIIEDSFLGLLVVCTVYSLWRSSLIPAPVGDPIARKSRTRAHLGCTSSRAAVRSSRDYTASCSSACIARAQDGGGCG